MRLRSLELGWGAAAAQVVQRGAALGRNAGLLKGRRQGALRGCGMRLH